MELHTRCPRCDSVFPVNVEQLQRRRGYIRCLQCAHIFDGFESVVDDPVYDHSPDFLPAAQSAMPVNPVLRSSPQPVTEPQSAPEQAPLTRPVSASPSVIRGRGQPEFSISLAPSPELASGESNWHLQDEEGFFHDPEPALGGGTGPVFPEPDQGDSDTLVSTARDNSWHVPPNPAMRREPVYHEEQSRWQGAIKRLLLLACILGLIMAGLQLIYIYRVQIASVIPASRPALAYACTQLNCDLPFERRINDVAIAASSFKNLSGTEGLSVLGFTLRNRFKRAQQWPAVTLELKDFSGALLLRRHILPASYLSAAYSSGAFPPGSEMSVELPVDVGSLKVNGYQLDLYFP